MSTSRIFAASAALLVLSACGEANRPVGYFSSLADGGASNGGKLEGGGSSGVEQAGEAAAGAPKLLCESLGRCGGDLLRPEADANGNTQWIASSENACQDAFPPLEPYDACDGFSVAADESVRFKQQFPARPLKSLFLSFRGPDPTADPPEPTFVSHAVTALAQSMFFSQACLKKAALPFSCARLGRRIKEALAAESNTRDMRCADDGAGGCACNYRLVTFTSVPGTWSAKDGAIQLTDLALGGGQLSPMDYCVQGNELKLSSRDSQPLLATNEGADGLFPRDGLGPHTVTFRPPSCTDGQQDGDEDGIDCIDAPKRQFLRDNACPVDCTATCSDGVQNQGETGVDCGSASGFDGCTDDCACFNGAQDDWEEGVDCGGPCALTCECKNGMQDANEAGVDCGGHCLERYGDPAGKVCP
jgi:hypothetical protein